MSLNKQRTGVEANFSLESGFGNHLQSLSPEPTPPAFPKTLSALHSLNQANPFLLEINRNNLKISVAYNGKGVFALTPHAHHGSAGSDDVP